MIRGWLVLVGALGGITWAAAGEVELSDNPAIPDELVADQQTLVPCQLPKGFTSFRYPNLDEDLSVTFIGDDPHYRGGEKFGVYRSEGRTGQVVKLINNEDTVGGSASPFTDFLGLRTDGKNFLVRGFREDGRVGLYGDFGKGFHAVAETGSGFISLGYGDLDGNAAIFVGTDAEGVSGLFLYDASNRTTTRLVDLRRKLPDGSRLTHLHGNAWMDAGSIVFRAHDEKRRPGIYRLARPSAAVPLPEIEAVVTAETVFPTPFEVAEITSAPVDGQRIVFGASGRGADGSKYTGIFLFDDGKLQIVADNQTGLPEEGIQFHSFNKWVALQNGIVLFRGFDATGFEGVFAFDSGRNQFYRLIDNRASIEGRAVKSFEIANNPVVGDRIALLVVFQDGKDALYLASLQNGSLSPR